MTITTTLLLGLICHLVGDYILQSHWMAVEKTSKMWPAIVHGVTYTLPFLLITQSIPALLVICITHILIDRYRLAKYLVWLKNQIGPKSHRPMNPWRRAKTEDTSTVKYEMYPRADGREMANPDTGYPASTPAWMAVWLMIISDNTVHILINTLALLFL